MHVLLTGATGYLGRHLLARLLDDGHRVTVLVRPRRGRLQKRIIDALRPLQVAAHGSPLPEIQVLAGDITAAHCGLAVGARAALRASAVDAVVHAAGLTRFEAHLAADIRAHNLAGACHARALAVDLGVPRFHHVSTAFVAGTATTPFGAADLDLGQGFNNPYEEAKYEAELALRAATAAGGPALSIYRPSIIVGGCALGDGATVSTVYTFVKALHFLRECARRECAHGRSTLGTQGVRLHGPYCHIPLRVSANADLAIDLVHIDDVVDVLIAGLADNRARLSVHQVTGIATPLSTLRDGICAGLEITGPELVMPDTDDTRPRSRLEQHFARITRVYQPYLRAAPCFVRTLGAAPRPIDVAAFTREFLARIGDSRGRRASRGVGALALAVGGVQQPRDYFRALIAGEIGRHFLARYDFIDARVRFRITGDCACDATVHFSHGRACTGDHASPLAVDCTYTLDCDLFMRIITGRADMRTAFFAGRVRIDGDKELALKFGALLGMYYQHIDEHTIEEVAV